MCRWDFDVKKVTTLYMETTVFSARETENIGSRALFSSGGISCSVHVEIFSEMKLLPGDRTLV